MTFTTGGLYGIEAIRGNATLVLHSQDGPLIRVGEEGFDIARARRLQDQGPLQHGVTDIGFRLEARSCNMTLDIVAEEVDSFYALQDELFDFFKPSDEAIQIRFTRPDGKVRQIDLQCLGGVRGDPPRATIRRVGFEFYAPDPTFYNPDQQSVNFGITAGGGSLTVPVPVPTPVGSSVVDHASVISYQGNWISYPVVVFQGPISDPVVYNLTTNEKLDLTGTSIAAGQEWTIDCRFDAKTVVDQTGANQIAALTSDSDLATFHLEPNPGAPGGDNSIRVTGSGATSATQVYVRYYERYSHR